MAEIHEGIFNLYFAATIHNDKVIFLHQIHNGATPESYGIFVARSAGVSTSVIECARKKLAELQRKSDDIPDEISPDQFQQINSNPIVEDLAQLDLDSLSPREAWKKLENFRVRAINSNKTAPMKKK